MRGLIRYVLFGREWGELDVAERVFVVTIALVLIYCIAAAVLSVYTVTHLSGGA
jgi:hypothetical protein